MSLVVDDINNGILYIKAQIVVLAVESGRAEYLPFGI